MKVRRRVRRRSQLLVAGDEAALLEARKRLGVGDAPFILAIGVIEPRKNLNRLMDAFAVLQQRGIAQPSRG